MPNMCTLICASEIINSPLYDVICAAAGSYNQNSLF